MPMMASQILKAMDFAKTQKSRYLKNRKKKSLTTHQGLLFGKKYFCSEGNL